MELIKHQRSAKKSSKKIFISLPNWKIDTNNQLIII